MLFKNNLVFGIIYDVVSPLFENLAVTGCLLGLIIAYYVSQKLGWDQKTCFWTLAVIGTLIGIIFDFDGMRSEAKSTLHMLCYLSFVLFIMGGSVLMVIYYLGPQVFE